MQRYQSHKQVHAEPMDRGAYNHYRGWAIPADEDPEDPGYLVVYNMDTEDHYESWSPKHIFDDGYTPINEGEGFARLFHSEEYGQILFTQQSDPDTLDPTLEITIENPHIGLVVSSEDFTEAVEINEILGTLDQDTAIQVVKAILQAEADE